MSLCSILEVCRKTSKHLKYIGRTLNESLEVQKESLSVQRELLALLKCQNSDAAVIEFWVVNPDGTKRKINMAFTLTAVQQVPLAITATDARGNPAKLDGAPVWESSDVTLLTVAASEDGMACTVTAVGPIGTAQVKVTADALIGEGTRDLLGVLDIEIVAGEALNVVIVPGTPV